MLKKAVPPVGAEVEEWTVITLVLVLAKLLLTGVSVVGEVNVPPFVSVSVPVKDVSRLSATVTPPAILET
jgi:hypothetical protein